MSPVNKSPTVVRRSSPTPSIEKQKQQATSPQRSLELEPLELEPLELESPEAANDRRVQAAPVERLWLCVHLPVLPLEALTGNTSDSDDDSARAVFDDVDGIRKVLMANDAAVAASIGPGLSVNAALALLPTLELEQRDVQCEQRTLLSLAEWAEQFTSFVTVDAPTILLLELAGSIRLFSGLRALRRKVSDGLGELGFTASLAIAPTPLAATWFARVGKRVCIQDMANITSAVSALPLSCLRWPDKTCELLYGMGMSQLGDCLRLPRQGFAKRFGAGRLLELDRGVGRLPDPRVSYRTPARFSAEYELCEELGDSELILVACEQLLQKLEQFLLTRQLAVQRLLFSFFHLQHPATRLPVGCVQSDRSARHWIDLLRIRFERVELAGPVIAIQLRAAEGQAMSAATGALQFQKKDAQQRNLSIEHLVERLGARIGDERVHGVTTVAEHRPQYAWRRESSSHPVRQCPAMPGFWYEHEAPQLLANSCKTNSLLLRRPLWMLDQPEPLAVRDHSPIYQGRLKIVDGPERLETGWWDEDGIARDYFVAANPGGAHLWIYRNRSKDGGWYLHGVFG